MSYWALFAHPQEEFKKFADSERGELLGSLVGKYGIEILGMGATVKSISVFKKLKDANRLCYLESMAASEINMEVLTSKVVMHAAEREKFLQNIKIRWDRQNKHLPGKHNFDPERGIIKISEEKLEEIIKQHAGKGQRVSNITPFNSGYKERVDFGEIIGEFALKEEGKKLLLYTTTNALIHYTKDGGVLLSKQSGFY